MYRINVGEEWRNMGIDIIIPYHKQYKIVEDAYRAVTTTPVKFGLTLVDDHSPNAAFGESFRKRGLNVVRNPQHSGFGASLRAGFEQTSAPFVCFMHSDVLIRDPRWLLELQRSLMRNDDRTIVVPKSDNPGDSQQLKGKIRQYGKDEVFGEMTCPLYCFLGLRTTFERIGLPQPYPYGMYEDDEYSHRLRKHKYKIIVSGRSWVSHIGGATLNSIYKDPKIAAEMMANRERCIHDMKR